MDKQQLNLCIIEGFLLEYVGPSANYMPIQMIIMKKIAEKLKNERNIGDLKQFSTTNLFNILSKIYADCLVAVLTDTVISRILKFPDETPPTNPKVIEQTYNSLTPNDRAIIDKIVDVAFNKLAPNFNNKGLENAG